MKKLVKLTALCIMGLMFSMCKAQSPYQKVSGTVAGADLKITYNAPSVRGREIFGGLVGYDKVWRAGANAATTLTTSKDIMVEDKKLAAGSYAVFIVPHKSGAWTVIFNSNHGRSGATVEGLSMAEYDKDNKATDVLRVDATPKKSASATEQLQFSFDSTGLIMNWADVTLPISIK